ncbi:MAG: thioredoxin domain-containing protein [Candidatus Methylomirabilales bacterium]
MVEKHTNRLIGETSPYLLQHAHNPVDWYAWGEEALERARAEDRPILLSIGYSACHWCHVMERESFEREEIAELMGRCFVNIKVDREERPDLDQIYQAAVQLLGVRGGWPLTVFLTPDLEPFYGGTYFPPEDRFGLPGFPRVLQAVADLYRQRREEITHHAGQLKVGLIGLSGFMESSDPLTPAILERAARVLTRLVDPVHGGFGGAPKFPQASTLDFLLRHSRSTGDATSRDAALLTLRKMAEGGIYDQLGGGFHRYSVDERWLVPHFEKMLYDNALLLPLYCQAYQLTKDPFFSQVVRETVDYLLREMAHPEGGFYATQDADSEGEEGKFFVWTHREVLETLGSEAGEIFCRAYGVTEEGNWEHGRSILHRVASAEQLARRYERPAGQIAGLLAEGKAKLFTLREGRVKPFRDEKVLADWSSLAISACAKAYTLFEDRRALGQAVRSVDFILARLIQDGRLLHVYKDGQAKHPAYLDDYAFFVAALLDLFEATSEEVYLHAALEFHHKTLELFWDEAGAGFFFTGKDQEALLIRPKSSSDHATPSGCAVVVMNLLRLFSYTGEEEYRAKAGRTLRLFRDHLEQNPFGFGHLCSALDLYLNPPPEIVILGHGGASDTQDLLRAVHRSYLPVKTLLVVEPGASTASPSLIGSLLSGKGMQDGRATAYVCQGMRCSPPVTDPEELTDMLAVSGGDPERQTER